MAIFITIIIGGPAQVLIFPTRWLVAATIISSRGFGCADSIGRGEALWIEAAEAAIATILIVPILLVVSAEFFEVSALLKQ